MQSSPSSPAPQITKRTRTILLCLGILAVVTISLIILRGGQPADLPLRTQPWGMPVVISADGRSVATADTDALQVYDVSTRRLMNLEDLGMDHAYDQSCYGIAFSPDGKTLVCGGIPPGAPAATLNTWDVSSGKHLRTFAIGQVYGQAVVYSPDGKLIATGGKIGILLWDAHTGVQVGALKDLTNTNDLTNITSLAFSSDGRYLASGGMAPNTQIECWDVLTHKVLWSIASPEIWTSSVAFSPDGQSIATGGTNGVVYIWKAKTGGWVKIISVNRGREGLWDYVLSYLFVHTHWMISPHHYPNQGNVATNVLYSRDGKLLIAGGPGGVHVFSASSYKLLRALHASSPIAMFPDSKHLITGTLGTGKAEVWTLDRS